LHVADGQAPDAQTLDDGEIQLNGLTLFPNGRLFEGDTVPNAGTAASTLGGLWDIREIGITQFLSPGMNNVTLTSQAPNGGVNGVDCIAITVGVVIVSPPPPVTLFD